MRSKWKKVDIFIWKIEQVTEEYSSKRFLFVIELHGSDGSVGAETRAVAHSTGPAYRQD